MAAFTHDLNDFLKQASDGIRAEYDRITKRSKEDPGTAGDEGEINWKELLEAWLPAHFHVENKGRIIYPDGKASPQVDIVVLSPEYPKGLAKRKLFLASNVLAAFECKLTLRPNDIRRFFENSVAIQSGFAQRQGTLYREIHGTLIYGMLAHSHAWKSTSHPPARTLETYLYNALSEVPHPRHMPDVLCVADLGTWTASKLAGAGSYALLGEKYIWTEHPPTITGGFMQHYHGFPENLEAFQELCNTLELPGTNHLGAFIGDLLVRMAWLRRELRPLASYFRAVGAPSPIAGNTGKVWPLAVCSNLVQQATVHVLKEQQPPHDLEDLLRNPKLIHQLSNLQWNELGPQFV
jgi:hypothetical protein